MPLSLLRRISPAVHLTATLLIAPLFTATVHAAAVVSEPFAGVRYTHRTQTLPRRLSIHILEIDLTHPGILLLISPGNGATRGENTPRTVRSFVTSVNAQIRINASSFLSSAAGANFDNRGVVASQATSIRHSTATTARGPCSTSPKTTSRRSSARRCSRRPRRPSRLPCRSTMR